ncbi:ribosome recycling factor [Xylaria arbuscula]|nr:ribosome recycling factor [Xylaria arbuscula]
MSNSTAHTLLRHGFVRPQAGRVCNVARAGNLGATAPYTSQSIYQRYEQRPLLNSTAPRSLPISSAEVRSFHTSPAQLKKDKGGRGKSNEKPAAASNNNNNAPADEGGKHPQPSSEEPLNFDDVASRLQKHAEHFKAALKKMQTGSRFDPDAIGGLRVTVDKKTGDAYPLHELAQVVPRGGRSVSLLVHEAEYVKPIMSAVQTSDQFNQQPQRDPDNELELILKVEVEKPEDLVKRVKAVAHEWRERIRAVRQKRDKLHATWKKEGAILPDMKKTADKELEKVIKTATAEVDAAEAAVKASG